MAVHELVGTIDSLGTYFFTDERVLHFPKGFLTPGALVVLTAFAKLENLAQEQVVLPSGVRGYCSAIGLSKALWESDDYPYERLREGITYSSLEHLNSPDATDTATARIGSCVRRCLDGYMPPAFVASLCAVVGDLHSNVWSHGRASGFSMAQRWKAPKWPFVWTSREDHEFEFALADCGLGFLGEMRRVGMAEQSHRGAIEWCIQEGHSTKLLRPAAEWAQRLPEDAIGNPFRGAEETRRSDDHHMGLGLFKFMQLIKGFRGKLWLASGDAFLKVAPDKPDTYSKLAGYWQGVALACRFRASDVAQAGEGLRASDQGVEDIMKILGGSDDSRSN